jgi:hypothetical protein
MARKKNRDQVILRISMENGIPRVRPLTAREQRQFFKTHPKARLPTFSLEEIERGLEEIEKEVGTTPPRSQSPENLITDPRTISIVNGPSGG